MKHHKLKSEEGTRALLIEFNLPLHQGETKDELMPLWVPSPMLPEHLPPPIHPCLYLPRPRTEGRCSNERCHHNLTKGSLSPIRREKTAAGKGSKVKTWAIKEKMICFEDTHGWKITLGEEPRHLCSSDRSCLALSSPKAGISVQMNFVYHQGYTQNVILIRIYKSFHLFRGDWRFCLFKIYLLVWVRWYRNMLK